MGSYCKQNADNGIPFVAGNSPTTKPLYIIPNLLCQPSKKCAGADGSGSLIASLRPDACASSSWKSVFFQAIIRPIPA